jgi:serine/threonine protein kinase
LNSGNFLLTEERTQKLRDLEICEEAIDLIQKLVNVNPTQRLKIDNALCHPWIQERPLTRSWTRGKLRETVPLEAPSHPPVKYTPLLHDTNSFFS